MDRQTQIALALAGLGVFGVTRALAGSLASGKTIRDRLAHLEILINKQEAKWKTPGNAIRSVIWVESRGKVDLPPTYERTVQAYSYGPMQVLLSTAQGMGFTGTAEDLQQAEVNLHYGTRYLTHQLRRYGGDLPSAAAAYNAGSARKRRGTFINQSYVNKVMGAFNALQRYDQERGTA